MDLEWFLGPSDPTCHFPPVPEMPLPKSQPQGLLGVGVGESENPSHGENLADPRALCLLSDSAGCSAGMGAGGRILQTNLNTGCGGMPHSRVLLRKHTMLH